MKRFCSVLLLVAGPAYADSFCISGETCIQTLVKPVVGDFTNASHDHGDADDGGAVVLGALPAGNDDEALVSNGTTFQAKAVPNCTDTGGNHLNYTASSNAFSCGTSGGASVPGADTQCIFNDGGAFGADAGCVYNKTTDTATFAGNVNAEDVGLEDSNASHRLVFTTTSDLTADRNLVFVPGDAARTVTLFGDTTVPVATQQITFAGLTAARTITFDDVAQTVMTLGSNQSAAGVKTLSGGITLGTNTGEVNWGSGNLNKSQYDTTNAPDALKFGLGTVSRSLIILDQGDIDSDVGNGPCGAAACAELGINIVDAAASSTEYRRYAHWGSAGQWITALVDGAATSVVQIPIAAAAGVGGKLRYSIFATDGTDHQMRSGFITFVAVNKAATETCTLSGSAETSDGSVIAASTGTLTYAITCDTTPTNAIAIQFNTASSIENAPDFYGTLETAGQTGVGEPAPQ